ncbi:hypothetical protein [Leuconostoc lactis]|uniref:hypothetical protein n=1 Tax=Leuconostoc lactis TaxID=1246 RepID=UPI0011438ECF|nr:hypothetical protein [Leuconostoc lactis]
MVDLEGSKKVCENVFVSTKNGDVDNFGINNVTLFLADVNGIEQLTRNLIYLFIEKYLKGIEISKNGYRYC